MLCIGGCVESATTRRDPGREPDPLPAATYVDARPAALVDGRSVTWGELRDGLTEASGAEILQELVLERRLVGLCRERDLLIDERAAAAEQQRLLASLDAEDPEHAVRLLDDLRNRQRLGPTRYAALLRRNAMLRALVQPEVEIGEPQLRATFDAVHGPKRRIRLATAADLGGAERVRREVRDGAAFADVATRLSNDASAARGGLLEPFSRLDPSWPESIREAAWSLEGPGAISDPMLLEQGYAVIQLVEELPGDAASFEEERGAMTQLVRAAQERVLMDRLARRLVAQTRLTIFDDALDDAWNRARRR